MQQKNPKPQGATHSTCQDAGYTRARDDRTPGKLSGDKVGLMALYSEERECSKE